MNKPQVSIVILTINGLSENLSETLDGIYNQGSNIPYEIIAIDNGSKDGTVEFLRKNPKIRLKTIPYSAFGHGKTRRLGAELAKGELVVFLTHDAAPANKKWLSSLLKNFRDPKVVGVCSRVVPRSDASLLKKIEVNNDLAGREERIEAKIENKEEFDKLSFYEKRLNYYFFHDISSCVRRDYYLKKPAITTSFAEDVEFARMALSDGKKIVFEPNSIVYHSHDYQVVKTYKRNLTDSKYHREHWKVKNVPTIKNLLQNTIYLIRRDISELKKYKVSPINKLVAILYSPVIHFAEQLGQYRGTRN